ncbi:MAG TPA: hypothetical protein VN046_07970 [Stenotrophobium sp.]|jgi:hypothetical protein|nr:hypothetical protein [Stenotrophobium sp.]
MNLITSIGEFLFMSIVGLLVAFPAFLLLRSLSWNRIWRRLLRLFDRHWQPVLLRPYTAATAPHDPAQPRRPRE